MKPQYCPLAGIDGAIMTKNGFISACLARQFKEIKLDPCPECKKGQVIKAGKWPGPPSGIIIFIPTDFEPAPIIIPELKTSNFTWRRGREPIYPFTTMKVGETCRLDAANKKNIRTAAGQITRRHGKKFVNHVDGDFIIFERIK